MHLRVEFKGRLFAAGLLLPRELDECLSLSTLIERSTPDCRALGSRRSHYVPNRPNRATDVCSRYDDQTRGMRQRL